MLIEPNQEHWTDPSTGSPAGGVTWGPGYAISWQNGPLGRGDSRREPNGAFVESIIRAAVQRLESYQSSQFECGENRAALHHLNAALGVLNERTQRRESAGTEGTHAGD